MTPWFQHWNTAVAYALASAESDGYRWRVRHSHAKPGVWLAMRIVPKQSIRSNSQ